MNLLGTPVVAGSWTVGETNVPPELINNTLAVAAGSHFNLGLKCDGTVVGWGGSSPAILPPPELNGVVAIAAGYNHALALRSNGTVVAWGGNDSGQTNVPSTLSDFRAIAAGDYHCLALRSNGTVVAWGANGFGQATVPGFSGASAIAAGGNNSMALLTNGQVVGWGQNTYGEVTVWDLKNISGISLGGTFSLFRTNGLVFGRGNYYYDQLSIPSGLASVAEISAGYAHALALKSNCTIVAWGDNTHLELNLPSNMLATAVSAGRTHSTALRVYPVTIVSQPPSNTVICSGSSLSLSVTVSGSPPIKYLWYKNGSKVTNNPSASTSNLVISSAQTNDAGNYAVCVWNDLAAVSLQYYCVTSKLASVTVNTSPSITSQPTGGDVPVGYNVMLTVGATGTTPLYYQWRYNGGNIPGANSSSFAILNVQTFHSGSYSVVITNSYGAVTSENAVLNVHQPATILVQPVSQTVLPGSAVNFNVVATNATRYQWRRDNVPIPGATGSTYSIASVQDTNCGPYTVAVSNDFGGVVSSTAWLSTITLPEGTNALIVAWGDRYFYNGVNWIDLNPPLGLMATKIANGLSHSLGLSSGALVLGWGDNTYGQAGSPPSLSSVIDIAAGNYHSLALVANGTVVAWGKDDYHQSTVPPGLSGVVAIAAGANHSLALKNDGTIVGWGNSANGQTIPSPAVGNTNFMAIAAGENHSLGVRSNYTAWAWGANNYNQCRIPAGLVGVQAVAAGQNHSMALRTNGTVVVWGDDSLGQTKVPTGLSNVIAIACGANHCVALTRGGRTVSWGNSNADQVPSPTNVAGVLAISAKGDHSLFLKQLVLRIQEIHRLPNGNYRLLLRNEDGTDMSEAAFAKTQILASTDPLMSATNWVAITNNVWLINGSIQVEDTTTNLAQRYYISSQTP